MQKHNCISFELAGVHLVEVEVSFGISTWLAEKPIRLLFVLVPRSTQIKTYSWDNAQVLLVGNKCDMEDERVVSADRGRQLSEHLGEFHNFTSLIYCCSCLEPRQSDATFGSNCSSKKTLLNAYLIKRTLL